jgi:uncharacterized membrane protein
MPSSGLMVGSGLARLWCEVLVDVCWGTAHASFTSAVNFFAGNSRLKVRQF